MKTQLLSVIATCLAFLSCSDRKVSGNITVEATDTIVCYPIGSNTTSYIKSLSVFEDNAGKRYLAIMNNDMPEIYIYDSETQKPVKTISFEKEGKDGIGPKAGGFLMRGWDEIYLPNLFVPEISVADSAAHKKGTISLLNRSYPFITTRSVTNAPMVLQHDSMYCVQLVNPRLGKKRTTDSPVGFVVSMKDTVITPLPFCYPSSLCKNVERSALGIETNMSRCFNGNEFVYSFAFAENLYVVSKDHKNVREIQVKSVYIDKPELPDDVPADMTLAAKMMCELPFYGSILYDEYRQLYYRIVYPREELELSESFSDLWQSGRNRFAIMVLDKDFNVLGETMLPAGMYRSDLYYVSEDGLYISESHYKNPDYNEDVLAFRLFKIKN